MTDEITFLTALFVIAPNWAGWIALTVIQSRFNERLLQIIEKRAERDRVEYDDNPAGMNHKKPG